MAKKKETTKYVIGDPSAKYIMDNPFNSIKDAEKAAAEYVLGGNADTIDVYELRLAKKIKITVSVEEVK